MSKHIVIHGDPITGFEFIGPFDDEEQIPDKFTISYDGPWSIAKLAEPPAPQLPVIPRPQHAQGMFEHLLQSHDTNVQDQPFEAMVSLHAEYHANAETLRWDHPNAHTHPELVTTTVLISGYVYAEYVDGKVERLNFTPVETAIGTDITTVQSGDNDLDCTIDGPFWSAVRVFLSNNNTFPWIE